jgi:ribosomal protein S27AE
MSNGNHDNPFTPPENSALPIRLPNRGQTVAHSGGVFLAMQKTCFRCGLIKPLSEFYTHPKMADGHLNKCKGCTLLDVVKHRVANLDKIQQYDSIRARMPHRLEAKAKYTKRYKATYPEKCKARTKTRNAIRDGKITRQPCAKCGSPKTDAHHNDYSKPLEVTWLCVPCHHAEHRKYDYDKIAGVQPRIR